MEKSRQIRGIVLVNNVWVTSDWHIGHVSKMIEYCDRPINYEERILENLKKFVGDGDTLINLGDVIFGDRNKLKPFMDQIKGTKILIRGNHDHASNNWYHQNGFDVVCSSMIIKGVLMTHEAKHHYWGCYGNLHGHNHIGEIHEISKHHYLMSVERTNYQPVNFDKIQAALVKNYGGDKKDIHP